MGLPLPASARRRSGPRPPGVSPPSRLAAALRANRAHIVVAAGVLALFLANGSGLLRLIFGLGTHPRAALAVVYSPEFWTLAGVGLVLATVLPLLRPIQASLVTLLGAAPIVYLGYQHIGPKPLVPMEYSLLTVLMLYVVNVVLAFYRESHHKQRIIDRFAQYVPPAVVERIRHDPERFSMQAEAREITVMFCDVHDFTAISERLEPPELSRLLNALFTPITEILYRHMGVIDKYMGDAVMAFWGAPLDDPAHAGNAIAAAFEIQDELARLTPRFLKRGWPALRMGIGINTGQASVGNMGSAYRVAYTAVGDAVNLAARLQDLTRVYHTPVICGARTRKAFPAATYRELGLVQVKGKRHLERIFEPCNPSLDPESTVVANLHRHNEALRRYYGREWDVAERLFQVLRDGTPDHSLYEYFLSRIGEFRDHPPPPDWRGEIRFTVK